LTFSYSQDGSGQYGNMTCSYNSYTSGPCATNTFNGANNRINTTGYSYDAAGDVLTDGTYGYTWDAEGRATSQSGSGIAGTSVFNALGQLAWSGYSGGSSSLLYDPAGQWIGQYNSAGYWWGEYVRLGGRVVAFNSQSQGITVFLHKDMQTTTHMATAYDGSLLQDQVFYPWGLSWHNLGTWYQQEFAGLDIADPSTDFYTSLSRIYNPTPGRWLSPDPAGLKAVDRADPQTWNMYAYVRDNPTTLTDPTGMIIDSSECDADKQCAKWKANYLKHKEAQKQWKALDENKELLVKLKWDAKSNQSVTGDYTWNDAGNLTGVTVTLAGKTGHVDNPLSSSEGYVFGSTIKTDPLRQAYVVAHEFAHVEQAQEPGSNVLYNWMSQQGSRLSQAEQQHGPGGYSKLDWTGPLERTLDALHLTLERGADARAKEVVTGDDDQ
jgi:RHS repeat-associated protein